jgi:AcrR family transcriptional regulator
VAEAVNSSRRSYVSGRRARQAAATRTEILQAAEELFVARGYAGATVEEIANQAGVAVPTVYKAFGNKANILSELVAARMAGDDEGGDIKDQAWWREQLEEPLASQQLELIARNARRIYERAGGVLDAVGAAAPSDQDVGELWAQVSKARRERSGLTARSLASKAGVRDTTDPATVRDVLWSMTAPEMFTLLVVEGRWSPQRYERWLAGALKAILLANAASS